MNNMTFEVLLEQAQKLSPSERLRLVELLAVTLPADFVQPAHWRAALKATYGILADDPIERPPQLPVEERDPVE